MYLPRVLGLGAGAVCVGGGLYEIGAPLWAWVILAAQCYVWPHFASYRVAELCSLPLLLCYPVTVGYTAYRLARRVRQQNDLLSTLSTIDGLTRLLNRTNWEQQVATEFARCRRIGHSSAVLML